MDEWDELGDRVSTVQVTIGDRQIALRGDAAELVQAVCELAPELDAAKFYTLRFDATEGDIKQLFEKRINRKRPPKGLALPAG